MQYQHPYLISLKVIFIIADDAHHVVHPERSHHDHDHDGSNAAKVHKFMIAPQDFSLVTGELTPTMKVKRHFVIEKYKRKIDQMYEHETQSSMW